MTNDNRQTDGQRKTTWPRGTHKIVKLSDDAEHPKEPRTQCGVHATNAVLATILPPELEALGFQLAP